MVKFIKKGNAAKLARVVIDYPNDADSLEFNITKTNATIPYEFKKEIKKLINTTKLGSIKKIIRGNRMISNNLNFSNANIWKSSDNNDHNSFTYAVDFEHPLFREFINQNKIKEIDLKFLLNVISQNLPVAKIIDNNDSDPSKHDRMNVHNKLSSTDLLYAKVLFNNKLQNMNKVLHLWLLNHEPYCYYEDELRKIVMNENIELLVDNCCFL